MKLLILHLSDFHFKDSYTIPKEISYKMIQALNSYTNIIDAIIIIITGDVAYSGKTEQYNFMKYFMKNIMSNIKNVLKISNFINIYVVPGNHDIEYNEKMPSSHSIYIEKDNLDKLLSLEPSYQENFFKYATLNHCFKNNKFIDVKYIKYGDFHIRINLINSACFSRMDNDKGIHYLSPRHIDKLLLKDNQKFDLILTAMHHDLEGFNEDMKLDLKRRLYKTTSLLFLGHEHKSALNDTSWDKNEMIVIYGGALSGHNINYSFNTVLIDSITRKVKHVRYEWNKQEEIFVDSSNNYILPIKCQNNISILPQKSYIDKILTDEKRTVSKYFLDYYVFPNIIINDPSRDEYKNITNWEAFYNYLQNSTFILVRGEDNSGKTSLLKYCYYALQENNITIYFSCNDMNNKVTIRIIKDAIEEQYGDDPFNFIRFKQTPLDKKIAFVDDIHKLQDNQFLQFFDTLKEHFGFIIITAKSDWDFDLIKKVEDDFQLKNKLKTCTIERFYKSKRTELISKLCKLKNINKIKKDEIILATENFVKTQLNLFRLDPDFILQVSNFYLQSNLIKTSNVFNDIFVANISQAIASAPSASKSNTNKYIYMLEYIAFYMHYHKIYPLPYSVMAKLIDKYNFEYNENINTMDFYNTVTAAKIIKASKDANIIEFCDNSYFAFFVAKGLNRKDYKNDSDKINDLEYILNNICYNINGDIILFLSFIAQDKRILMYIFKKAEEILEDCPEMDLDKKNIQFLFNYQYDIKEPDKESKKLNEKLTNIEEEVIVEQRSLKTINMYEENNNINPQFIQLLKASKYTNLLAKILPNFSFILTREEKGNLINKLYRYPNKLIYKCLHDIDKDFTNIIVNISNKINVNTNDEQKVSPEEIGKVLTIFSSTLILAIFNDIANYVSDKNTIRLLNEYLNSISTPNSNYDIQNLCMLEKIGNEKKFLEKATSIYDANNTNYVISMLTKNIVRYYLLVHDDINPNIERTMRDRFFKSQKEKSKLLLQKKYQFPDSI